MHMYVSVPQEFQKDPVSLEEPHNITQLASLSLLHKVGWAMNKQIFTICYHGQCAE